MLRYYENEQKRIHELISQNQNLFGRLCRYDLRWLYYLFRFFLVCQFLLDMHLLLPLAFRQAYSLHDD
jgi:hypothetical protein